MSDLEGLVIEADIHREQEVRRQGGTRLVRIHQNWKLSVDADKTLEFTLNTTSRGPGGGTRTAEPNFGSFKLDESREVTSRGGGEAVWKFADGTLTFIRTLPSGAFRVNYAFTRGPSGLTCTVTDAYARENGIGEIRMTSAFGGEVTIISTKQLPSTCKVTRK